MSCFSLSFFSIRPGQKRNTPPNLGNVCPRKELKSHVEKCRWRSVQCIHCHEAMQWFTLANHKKDECPERFVSCPWRKYGCKPKIKRKDVEKHCNSVETGKTHLEMKCKYLEEKLERVLWNIFHPFFFLFKNTLLIIK